MRQRSCAVIQHIAFEGLGGFAEPLNTAGYQVTMINAAEGVPDVMGGEDLVIILGGPISANDDDAYPFLRDELRLIERRLSRNQPVIGICLGAQLIARAAGARVFPQPTKEIGFFPITLSSNGKTSCLNVFEKDSMAFHWHGETFDLPTGATRLASTPTCENQAFALGDNVIGFQFHAEATSRNIEHWLIGHAAELAQADIDPVELRRSAARFADGLTRKAEAVMTSWLKGLEDRFE